MAMLRILFIDGRLPEAGERRTLQETATESNGSDNLTRNLLAKIWQGEHPVRAGLTSRYLLGPICSGPESSCWKCRAITNRIPDWVDLQTDDGNCPTRRN